MEAEPKLRHSRRVPGLGRPNFLLGIANLKLIAVHAAGKSLGKGCRLQNVFEYVEARARAHYANESILVDGACITLSDGAEIFLTRLYAELAISPEASWSQIVDDWLGMLDAIRARIAETG